MESIVRRVEANASVTGPRSLDAGGLGGALWTDDIRGPRFDQTLNDTASPNSYNSNFVLRAGFQNGGWDEQSNFYTKRISTIKYTCTSSRYRRLLFNYVTVWGVNSYQDTWYTMSVRDRDWFPLSVVEARRQMLLTKPYSVVGGQNNAPADGERYSQPLSGWTVADVPAGDYEFAYMAAGDFQKVAWFSLQNPQMVMIECQELDAPQYPPAEWW